MKSNDVHFISSSEINTGDNPNPYRWTSVSPNHIYQILIIDKKKV